MNIDLKVEEILMVIIAFVIGYVLSRVLSSNNIFKTPTKKIYGKHKTVVVGLGEKCNVSLKRGPICEEGLDCIKDNNNYGVSGRCKKKKCNPSMLGKGCPRGYTCNTYGGAPGSPGICEIN
jgi:hypothetical protein